MIETSPAKLEVAIEVYKKLYPGASIEIELLEKILLKIEEQSNHEK